MSAHSGSAWAQDHAARVGSTAAGGGLGAHARISPRMRGSTCSRAWRNRTARTAPGAQDHVLGLPRRLGAMRITPACAGSTAPTAPA